jgi:glutamate dehydrogenase
MEKYDFTMKHLYGENHHHITKILNILQAGNLEEAFVRKFYATIPMLNPTDNEYNLYAVLARNAFDFIKLYDSKSGSKIQLYQGQDDGKKTDHTIIEIISQDLPFLFDSAMCLLNRLEISIDRVAHPSIVVSRDQKGNLLAINDLAEESGTREIIIQIVTSHALTDELVEKIKNELNYILPLVERAVFDWENVLQQLDGYQKNFLNSAIGKKNIQQEQLEFLEKMREKYFVFLGSVEYNFADNKKVPSADTALGILKLSLDELDPLVRSAMFGESFFESANHLISIGKLNKTSSVHREANLDCLCLKILNEQGKIEKALVFIGLFTSILYYQSATLIPIIREKLQKVLDKAGFSSHSYVGKELVSIVESLPRDELFDISDQNLFSLIMEIYALLFAPELRIFLHKKGANLSCLVFLPLEIANADNLRKLRAALAFEYGPIMSHSFGQVNSSKLCYYYFIIDAKNTDWNNSDLSQIESNLKSITKPWNDSLKTLLFKEYGKNKGIEVFHKFEQAFPASYKESMTYNHNILQDIEKVSEVIEKRQIVFEILPQVENKANLAILKIYHLEELNLSSIMPMLQNMGFNITAEQIHVIEPYGNSGEVWLHLFLIKIDQDITLAKKNLEEALYAIWCNKCQNDPYNQLILKANLSYRQVTMLMGLAEYLCQIKIGYSKEYMGQVLNKHSNIAKLLLLLFYNMFDYRISAEARKFKTEEIAASLDHELTLIYDNVEDQIIRSFINLINNILRTNYFLKDQQNQEKDYISFKINSSGIDSMPSPRPYCEIFVYAANFEAIHLRGGKVARGGLRWSDRSEDYRSEVLGLMKTQIVKNAVIVPTGAKGGFILKNTAGLNRDELMARAIECYKNFLRGILDITDNIIDGKIHHPKHVVYYDEADSYLVVAADKGTATFSDIANQISEEYNFWLGDAFASGGSKGYDHKKMGITAKGGWISVARHFYEIGVDVDKDDFTVVGIGDMSGDVFGNGMLLSKHIRLLAAFNHMHIFIDPNPDSAKSFIERQRLFNLPRSTWLDYDANVLSEGARIYDRKAKLLELTPQIKERFKLSADTITPDAMIKVLLTAQVDLLWNGGIGTYIKANFEMNEQVGDKTNDNLRCNGEDLRCKVVGEGGNLGFTQYGRIEYARKGGRINTDAIDNSAGVDCSDHEVNIKIILNQMIKKQEITEENRVALLGNMTNDVAELVLKDNRTQTRALTIAAQEGVDILGSQEYFVNLLEEQGILDRKLECLPSKQQFTQLYAAKQGLTRPELSVLLAYSKNAIYNNLIESNLAEDSYFHSDLLAYFPKALQDKYAKELLSHPLRKEIIITAITNSMVNRVDTFYLHLTVATTGHKFSDIARAYTVTRDVFGLRELWKDINKLDGVVTVKDQSYLSILIKKFVMRSTSWLLRNYRGKIDISATITEFQDHVKELQENISQYLISHFKDDFEEDLSQFKAMNVPEELARKIALLVPLSSAYGIAEVADKKKVSIDTVCKIYFELGVRFKVDWLRRAVKNLTGENNWQKLAIQGLKDELYDTHRKIVASAVESAEKHNGSLEQWYKHNDKHIKLFDRFIEDVRAQEEAEYAVVDLSLKKLEALVTR